MVIIMKAVKRISNLWYRATYRFTRPTIKVLKASFSGDGSFVDVRYWLSRPDLLNSKITPYLITAQNQRLELMHLSKFGAIKSRNRKHTNTGILLFYNKDMVVVKGDRVMLYWGELKVEIVL